MKHRALFLGGSIGGKEDVLDGPYPRRGMPYVVPVISRSWPGAVGNDITRVPYERDSYLWEGERRGEMFVYRWERPNTEGLQRELKQLRKDLAACQNPLRKGLMRFAR